jgi:hypothetical protein
VWCLSRPYPSSLPLISPHYPQRWFAELAAFKVATGHCDPSPLASGVDLFLHHWCSIQRIALRSRVLPGHREQQLTRIGFDWTGADPLS